MYLPIQVISTKHRPMSMTEGCLSSRSNTRVIMDENYVSYINYILILGVRGSTAKYVSITAHMSKNSHVNGQGLPAFHSFEALQNAGASDLPPV